MTEDEISFQVVGAAIEVHRTLGLGLLESIYEAALAQELTARGMRVEKQKAVPVSYKGSDLGLGFRLDLLVNDSVVAEIKAVEKLLPVHHVQLLSYLKLTGKRLGLLINFNVAVMKSGIKRVVNKL